MLPILRIIPVGGVLLAIILLVLALGSPDGSRAPSTPNVVLARGALIEQGQHPEWWQFLMLAAIQRADELNRLRELPDTPTRTDEAPAVPKVAGLPTERSDTDPDPDETGSISAEPAATIPIDIGESSSTELPVAAPEEQPPVIRTPQRVKSRKDSRINRPPHARRGKAPAKPQQVTSSNFFEMLFGSKKAPPPTANANNY